MTDLIIEGARLEFRRWAGEAPPIVMLHEGLGSVAMWRDFPEQLAGASGLEVIAWSRRGHGRSALLPAPRDPDYMHREANLLPAIFDQFGIARAHLLGHSDGASIALIAAAQFPDLVASLILEAPHIFVEPRTLEGIRQAKHAYETTDLATRLGRYHNNPDHVFRRWNDIWLDDRFRGWNIEGCLARIKAPALLIQGTDDEYGTLDQIARLEASLPCVERLILEGCRHSPHRERESSVLKAVTRFIGRS